MTHRKDSDEAWALTQLQKIIDRSNRDRDALPGDDADEQARFLAPSVAVGEDRNGRYVFVVEPGPEGFGVTRRRPVTVGELREEGIEILEGVSDGDLVVIAGISKIVDGLKVKLLPERSRGR